MLIQERRITTGIARPRNGHVYLHRDHLPTWTQIEHTLARMYTRAIGARQGRAGRCRDRSRSNPHDLNEALEHPDARLGDDLLEVTNNPFDRSVSTRTMSGAMAKFRDAVFELGEARRHLDDVRRTV